MRLACISCCSGQFGHRRMDENAQNVEFNNPIYGRDFDEDEDVPDDFANFEAERVSYTSQTSWLVWLPQTPIIS